MGKYEINSELMKKLQKDIMRNRKNYHIINESHRKNNIFEEGDYIIFKEFNKTKVDDNMKWIYKMVLNRRKKKLRKIRTMFIETGNLAQKAVEDSYQGLLKQMGLRVLINYKNNLDNVLNNMVEKMFEYNKLSNKMSPDYEKAMVFANMALNAILEEIEIKRYGG